MIADNKVRLISVAGASLWALFGCTNVPQVPVADQWRQAITNFSLVPVYPPDENVYLGDVKLAVAFSTVGNNQLPYRPLNHVDLSAELDTYYGSRPSLPASDVPPSADLTKAWKQPTTTDDKSIFTTVDDKANKDRYRLAALPGVKVATAVQGAISAQIPINSLGQLGGGASGQSSRVFEITLTGIEAIEAPDDKTVRNKFETDFCNAGSNKVLKQRDLKLSLAQLIPATYDGTKQFSERVPMFDAKLLNAARPQVVIITRVFYARSIDYTFQTQNGFAADVTAVAGAIKDLATVAQAIPQTPPGPAPAGAPADGAAALQKQLTDAVAALRTSMSTAPTPSIALSTSFVDARGVTLRQVFERPLAFAAQGFAYDVAFTNDDATICPLNAAVIGSDVLLAPVPKSKGAPKQ